jgi:hypothetical protein
VREKDGANTSSDREREEERRRRRRRRKIHSNLTREPLY